MTKRLMTVKELSLYIAMPTATIYTYVSQGKIPSDCIRRIGRALKFEIEAVDRWVNGQTASQPSAPEHIQSAR